MADFYGNERAKGRTSPPTLSDGGRAGGRVRVIADEYTVTAATHSAAKTIELGREKLPKGATVIEVVVRMSGTAAGTGRTLSLGYDGAATAFLGATSVATTGTVIRGGTGVIMPSAQYLLATIGGGALNTGAVINVAILYTID